MIFGVIDIQFLDHSVRSQVCLDLCIDGSLYYLFEVNGFLVLLFYFNLNGRLKAFLKIIDYSKLIGSLNRIKFYKIRFKLLEMEYSILGFFLADTGSSF